MTSPRSGCHADDASALGGQLGAHPYRMWMYGLAILAAAAFGFGLALNSNVSGLILALYAISVVGVIAAVAGARHQRRGSRWPGRWSRGGR